ncbi:hypothetical protein CC2G_010019 [Coprinopsis cinerea AmutBmut pab1-1]|nr:hypothetical protein CC2G_010019 [Coprinopsis cinerea AmutBmut pab1-1]
MDEFSANVFNYCIGAFALCSTLASIHRYYRSILPSEKIVGLNEIVTEIRNIYDKAESQRLFPSERARLHAHMCLTDLESLTNELRERAYAPTTALEEFLCLVQGLSETISTTVTRAKVIRSDLLTTTEEERRRHRAAEEAVAESAHSEAVAPDTSASDISATNTITSANAAIDASAIVTSPTPWNAPADTNVVVETNIVMASTSNFVTADDLNLLPPSRSSTLVDTNSQTLDTTAEKRIAPGILAVIRSKLTGILPYSRRLLFRKTSPCDASSSYPDTLPPV